MHHSGTFRPMNLPKLRDHDYRQKGGHFITFCTENRAPVLSRVVAGGGVLDAPRVELYSAKPLWQWENCDHILWDEADFLRHWDYVACNSDKCAEDEYHLSHKNRSQATAVFLYPKEKPPAQRQVVSGADYEARTRYLHLGKVALYQMS